MKPYFEQNGISVYHGDCREVLTDLPAGSVDLLLTDPPYGVNYRGRGSHDVMFGDTDAEQSLDLLRLALGKLKLNRHFYVFGPFDMSQLTKGATCELIWDEEKHGGGALDLPWGTSHERITFGVWNPYESQRDVGVYIARLRRGSVLRYATPNQGKGATDHPTRKPVDLLRELIETSTRHTELVLDPFMGSGSTLFAARIEGRRAIGIDVEEKYCEQVAQGLAQGVLDFAALRGTTEEQ